ncbi:hypothetical protein HDU93_001578 [Gonapodya sp. JEL0774]|nr:hypothetical protein HDU93_001578 [Gonapodya sp. JEL0774]
MAGDRTSKPIEKYAWFVSSDKVKCPDLPVGEGYTSKVYVGELRGIPRVAIKILNPQMYRAGVQQDLELFTHEIEIWWRLKDHPNVCQVYGAGIINWKWGGKEQPCFFFAAPFLKNGDCSTFMHGKPISDKLRLLYEVASGMAHLHAQKVFHADLKPGNVMIDDQSSARIVDFGAAKADNFDTTTGMRVGTWAYMPPERLGGDAPTSAAGDVFAFGMTMYSILASRRPFPEKSNDEIYKAIVSDGKRPDVTVLVDVKPELVDLMQQCWADAPESRPSFDQIVKTLRKFVQITHEDQIEMKDLAVQAREEWFLEESIVADNQNSPLDAHSLANLKGWTLSAK